MKQYLYVLAAMLCLLAACKKNRDEVALPLSISGFLPSSGNPGTVVTIRGTGFGTGIGSNTVSFNGVSATVVSVNDTVLIVQAPEKGSTGPLTITAGNHTATGAVYTYQALSIHQVSPANGPEGTNISISGAGFSSLEGPAAVSINGHPAIVSNSNDTLLTAIVPAGAGSGAIEVTVNNTHATGPVFTFQSITKIKPATGGAGTLVTISGTGFNTTAASNAVAFNGQPGTVVNASATALQVLVPAQVKAGPVSVTINGQKTSGPIFTPVPPPIIRTIAPLSGPVGSIITIAGDNFSSISDEDTVLLNGKPLTIMSASSQQLTLMVPATVTTGVLRISVNGQAINGPQYTIQALGITQLLPDNGLDGSVTVVKGTGFDKIPANNHVSINGLAVTVTAATDTTLTVMMPTGFTTGLLNVSTGSLSAVGPLFRRAGVSLFYKGAMASGNVRGLVIDSKGNVFTAGDSHIGKITPDGAGNLFAGGEERGNTDGTGTNAKFFAISGMAIDAQDNLYVADAFNNNIRKITPAGKVTTFYASLDFQPKYLTIDAAGNLYAGSDYNGVFKISSNGTQVTQVARNGISSQFSWYNGYLYMSNVDGAIELRLNIATGENAVFAGAFYQGDYIDGPKGVGRLNGPAASTYDPVSGLLYIVDSYNYSIRTINPNDGTIGTITGAEGSYQPFRSGNKNGTLQEALLNPTSGSPLAVDKAGNIYMVEENLGQIRKVTLR